VLSGKELFNYNSSLFIDDDAAIDATEEKKLNAETRLLELEEEDRSKREAEKAQEEQRRLAEVQRIEEEECKRKDDERRRLAAIKEFTFILCGVVINQIVFDVEEKEDLEPLPDEVIVQLDAVEEHQSHNNEEDDEEGDINDDNNDDGNDNSNDEDAPESIDIGEGIKS
jgi:hypothetical protein